MVESAPMQRLATACLLLALLYVAAASGDQGELFAIAALSTLQFGYNLYLRQILLKNSSNNAVLAAANCCHCK
jgi:hypothetical protein